jgi:hypothetical protein
MLCTLPCVTHAISTWQLRTSVNNTLLENRYLEVQEKESYGERWWPNMPQHDERMQGSVLVNGPVDFEKGNYCTRRGGRVPKASVGSVHLSPHLTLAIQFRTQFLHSHLCKINWLSSAQMMDVKARKRVLNLRTGWRWVASVTPRPLYTRCYCL